jgi:hypothetical protein
MTVPIHSVKHIKAEYHRYQLMAIVSVIITIVAIILSAVTSFQVAHLGKRRAEAQSLAQSRAEAVLNLEATALKERLGQIEQQLIAEKAMVQQLNTRIATLQRQLSETKPVGNGALGSGTQSPSQVITTVPVPAADTKPMRGWTPTISAPTAEVKAASPPAPVNSSEAHPVSVPSASSPTEKTPEKASPTTDSEPNDPPSQTEEGTTGAE